MTNTERFSRLPDGSPYLLQYRGITKSIAIATLLLTAGAAAAQAPVTTTSSEVAAPQGYILHQTADLGGHMAGISGSGAMYDTLVNIHPGPRVLGQTLTLHAAPGTKHTLFDSLSATSNGFGGDPINVAKLDVSKGKLYEFNAMFRRDRQYFDYDLLGNPSVPTQTIPYGMVNGVATTAGITRNFIQDSPVMFNTVRRMTDTHLTITPLAPITYRFGYSQNIFQGPSTTPNRSIGKNDALLEEYQRNSNDDFNASIEWKPVEQTRLTFEEQVDHYKGDSYFTIAPGQFNAQLPDGTPVALGNWDATASPYTISMCNTASMGSGYTNATNYTIFTAPTNGSALPVVNPACAVTTKFLRTMPTRALIPTEMVRFQSSSIRNIEMNGDFRYTVANSNLPNYNETWAGLDGIIRGYTQTETATVQRRVVSFDYGIVWNVSKTFTLSDQVDYSNVHQPGTVNGTPGVTVNTPALTTGNANLNYNGPLVAGTAFSVSGNSAGTAQLGYYGQRIVTNNATVGWDPSARATFGLTYRYKTRMILQGAGSGSAATLVGIDENAGIFHANLRPLKNWTVNASAEISYDNNALVPVSPRQLKHYRVHTLYRIKPWATLSGAYNDIERHNNTNNTGTVSADGPLQHVDYNRTVSTGLNLAPSEKFAFDFNYSYTDSYYSTNACYSSGATTTLLGTASYNAAGGNNICPSSSSIWGPVKDFMSAPSQYASAGIVYTPNKKVRGGAGYRISQVNGNQFFADAQQVNGSLDSKYQTPYVNIAWTVRPGWIWKAEYNYYDYGEGGPSGPQYCSTSTSATATIIPCASSTLPSGLTEPTSGLSAPRTFHANIVTLSMHYEF
ncbi:hypothetical protein SAMN05421819_1355 [Bryocella elongata]|uniref:Uncharacterized protein n=1 Tax=Bryocella elongata TaxID=863522 RepID=A0A1H5VY42_9BACT|nr:hypothetical protein [Bryocella elongata]SEF91906.1 hypothetical protein SAMN05421819_1355 [Bryocella elongata]